MNSRNKGKVGERSMKKRTKKGTFASNQNDWCFEGDLLYCYLNGELLFFTDKDNWHLLMDRSISKMAKGYSATRIGGKDVLIHRLLTDAKSGEIVDHINRNKKDNRLSNLRKTDKSENAFNSKLRASNVSGTTGVWFRKDTGRWTAEIKKNYRKISLGCFETKEEAIQARKKAEVELYGYQLTN